MSEQIYKVVKLKLKTEADGGLPASIKVFVANINDDCNFNVDWFPVPKDNELLAKFIIEKMTRAYYEGYTDCIDEHLRER